MQLRSARHQDSRATHEVGDPAQQSGGGKDWSWGSIEEEWEGLTYGEFDLDFFVEAMAAAEEQCQRNFPDQAGGWRFVDLGSGCGRLVAPGLAPAAPANMTGSCSMQPAA